MSLIGLPETYRFSLFNTTGINLSGVGSGTSLPFTIGGRRVRFDSAGALSYEGASQLFFSVTQATLGNNSYLAGSTFSNTASGWLGGEFLLSGWASGGASGNVTAYLEISVDGGTTWPSPASANGAGGGIILAVIGFASTTTASTASTARTQAFEL